MGCLKARMLRRSDSLSLLEGGESLSSNETEIGEAFLAVLLKVGSEATDPRGRGGRGGRRCSGERPVHAPPPRRLVKARAARRAELPVLENTKPDLVTAQHERRPQARRLEPERPPRCAAEPNLNVIDSLTERGRKTGDALRQLFELVRHELSAADARRFAQAHVSTPPRNHR